MQRMQVQSLVGELRPPHAVGQVNPRASTAEPARLSNRPLGCKYDGTAKEEEIKKFLYTFISQHFYSEYVFQDGNTGEI